MKRLGFLTENRILVYSILIIYFNILFSVGFLKLNSGPYVKDVRGPGPIFYNFFYCRGGGQG